MTIDELLSQARSRLARLDPVQAYQATQSGAILIDTRPQRQRDRDGALPEAVVIERNHLEWRLDPSSPDRLPQAGDYDATWIICCNEGYSSSLAASTLHDLGLRNATDIVGGFQAWRAAGLPVTAPGRDRRLKELR